MIGSIGIIVPGILGAVGPLAGEEDQKKTPKNATFKTKSGVQVQFFEDRLTDPKNPAYGLSIRGTEKRDFISLKKDEDGRITLETASDSPSDPTYNLFLPPQENKETIDLTPYLGDLSSPLRYFNVFSPTDGPDQLTFFAGDKFYFEGFSDNEMLAFWGRTQTQINITSCVLGKFLFDIDTGPDMMITHHLYISNSTIAEMRGKTGVARDTLKFSDSQMGDVVIDTGGPDPDKVKISSSSFEQLEFRQKGVFPLE